VTEAANRFVRGAGEFSDHRRVEMATYAVVLRSPYAHAPIASITVSAALPSESLSDGGHLDQGWGL
jgi:CO/xanthine dehydrogenase Mo-binding subunit